MFCVEHVTVTLTHNWNWQNIIYKMFGSIPRTKLSKMYPKGIHLESGTKRYIYKINERHKVLIRLPFFLLYLSTHTKSLSSFCVCGGDDGDGGISHFNTYTMGE